MKRNIKLFFLVFLSFTLLVGCQGNSDSADVKTNQREFMPRMPDNPEKPYKSEEAIKNGDVVNNHGNISNFEKFEDFIANVRANKKDNIRITAYTTEGDPIFYNLQYDGTNIQYTFDNSQDGFAGQDKGKKSTTCSKIEKKSVDTGVEYYLSGCSSEDVGNTFYFNVHK